MSESKYNESESKTHDAKSTSSSSSSASSGDAKALPPQLSESEIIDKVQEYFYGDEKLANLFENFVKDECHVVDLNNNEEYKLEYTEVFNRYKNMFENEMEEFITRQLKLDVKDFYYALKGKMDGPDQQMSNEAIFGQILIAVTDFDVFMTMMRECAQDAARSRQQQQKQHK